MLGEVGNGEARFIKIGARTSNNVRNKSNALSWQVMGFPVFGGFQKMLDSCPNNSGGVKVMVRSHVL